MKRKMVNLSAWLLVFAVLMAGCGSSAQENALGKVTDLIGNVVSNKAAESSQTNGEPSVSRSAQDEPQKSTQADTQKNAQTKASPTLGDREKPIPWGRPGKVGTDWEIQIQDIDPDAWSVIETVSRFNDPPEEGRQYVLVKIKISNVGENARKPGGYLTFKYLGTDGLAYDKGCGDIPDPLKQVEEMYPGGATEANICVSVPSKAVKGGSVIVRTSDDETFFAGVPKK